MRARESREVSLVRYGLYSNDVHVADFEYERSEFTHYQPLKPDLLPMQIRQPSPALFALWLYGRSIDMDVYVHRRLMRGLLDSTDRVAAAIATHLFSVTDLFTCFKQNEFRPRDTLLVKSAQGAISQFVLVSSDTSLRLRSHVTPNASTDGGFPKTWKYDKNKKKWWLYKIQSESAVLSELHISRALRDCGWDATLYRGVRQRNTQIKTENFVKEREFFEPYESFRHLFPDISERQSVILANFTSLGGAFAKAFRRILLADALFMNTDRHMRNFGVIRDAQTGETLRLAPNFDNNQAFRAVEGVPYNPVMLGDFREALGFTGQDRADLAALALACEAIPYLKEAGIAARQFLRTVPA